MIMNGFSHHEDHLHQFMPEKGRELLEKYKYKKLDTRYTYIFEIIFKEGRIVCKYDFEDLIMIGCINIETGIERLIHNCDFEGYGFKVVKRYDGINDFKVLKTMIAGCRGLCCPLQIGV